MKIKKYLILLFLLCSLSVFSQSEYKFAGLDWYSSPEQVDKVLEHSFLMYNEDRNADGFHTIRMYSGTLFGEKTDGVVLLFFEAGLSGVMINLQVKENNQLMFFSKLQNILIEKYGNPDISSMYIPDLYENKTIEEINNEIVTGKTFWGSYWNPEFQSGASSLDIIITNTGKNIVINYNTKELGVIRKKNLEERKSLEELF